MKRLREGAKVREANYCVAHAHAHAVHIVIDGSVRRADRTDSAARSDSRLERDGAARTCLDQLRQPRDFSWSLQVELRPWVGTY